jgi:hypothetical protein
MFASIIFGTVQNYGFKAVTPRFVTYLVKEVIV